MDTLCVYNAETWVACGRYYGIAHRPQGSVWPFGKVRVKVQPGTLALLKYGRSCSEDMKKKTTTKTHEQNTTIKYQTEKKKTVSFC